MLHLFFYFIKSNQFINHLLFFFLATTMLVIDVSSVSMCSQQVTVENLEKGILINVLSKKSCQGLLVFILEAFEELGLNVLDARVSCTDTFSLQAVGGELNEENGETIDAQVVKQALLKAIRNWSRNADQQE
ncbi:hypothetical protein Pint_06662 [Pistacia integerrima]|uniref:Uncharacterized protein n=1 Tax=Pistacia integerrima TaxID=434235 RepID=A0ACC0ZAG6_9ROSI|nr:hypothetical protein Pint_06662 [Pistacia integerrima]